MIDDVDSGNEFEEETPTKREISETLAEALERWRSEAPSERPTVRMKPLPQELQP
jgi:hypothetical protein